MVRLSSEKSGVKSQNRTDWKAINQEILQRLDLKSEFASLGIIFAAESPAADGWLPCHSIDRRDNSASAAVCLASSNGCLGRYKDFGPGGPEKAISFFDLAVRIGRFPDFKQAQAFYADRAGISLSRERHSGKPARDICDQVELIPSDSRLYSVLLPLWSASKPGVSLDAAKRCGRLCRWPAKKHDSHTCVGFPAFDPSNWSKPTAIVLYRACGDKFPAVPKHGLTERKTHLPGGSRDGLILACTRNEFAAATTVWKCEGVTDALALAPYLAPGHVAVTNACGAKSFPKELATGFTGKRVLVVHDADQAGEAGAQIVIKAIAPVVADVRQIKLPYPVSESHGKDARDFIADGGTIEQLLAIAAAAPPIPLAEAADVEAESDDQPTRVSNAAEVIEPGDTKPSTIPLPIRDVLDLILGRTDDWPRRVGNALFVHDAGGDVSWLESTPALFGWMQSKCGIIHWHRTKGCASREECYCEFQRTATPYVSVEQFPHHPLLSGHYYACPPIEPGEGAYLRKFIKLFTPDTDIDGDLIRAALLTLLWGGDGGTRPAFVFTADKGRGRGKSKCAEMLARVVGGAMDFSANEKIGDIKTRLLSGGALSKRVALLDNVKSLRFSWSELEGLITAPEISGKRMYLGEATRPNTLTWFITLNGASLSTDMAQRSVVIKIGDPERSKSWEDDTKAFVDANRHQIIADAIGMLESPDGKLDRCSRWATWERSVLSCLPEPSEAQTIILERQTTVDVEKEEAGMIEDHFRQLLIRMNYEADWIRIFIPSDVAAQWFCEATGEKKSVIAIGRILSQLISEGQLPRLQKNHCNSNGRGFVWSGKDTTAVHTVVTDIRTKLHLLKPPPPIVIAQIQPQQPTSSNGNS